MRKTIFILSAIAIFISMSSFQGRKHYDYAGTYGVSQADPAQIKLIINKDHSFYYQNFSNTANKIIIHGSWATKGKRVILTGNQSNKNFHSNWRFDSDGLAVKSRKGFTYYRLCRIGN